MAILHIQFSGLIDQTNGQSVPSKYILIQNGPVAQVSVTLSDSIAKGWLQQGITIPSPITGNALIDTGASATCIDEATAQALQLPIIDVGTITSATHESQMCNIYPIKFEILGSGIVGEIPRAIGANLTPQNIIMLIGRDWLSNCTLHYNGVSGDFTLSV